MSWWKGFADRIECDAPLAGATWFRLGGRARFLFRPRSVDDLRAMIVRAGQEEVPLKVLGCGANVLVSDDGFDGVVVRLDAEAFRAVHRRGRRLEVGAGVDLMPLCRRCSEQGFAGLEGLAGIPATVGGAVRMNAGGRFGDMAGVVRRVQTMRSDGEVETWSRERMGFGYRHSGLGNRLVLSVELELAQDDPDRVRRRYAEHFAYKTRTQPLEDRSAGCVFKNPAGQSAGALIDRAGFKGFRYGQVGVSARHANFIVAQRGATASDVLRLIDLIRDRVRRLFDTELELEVEIWKSMRRRRQSA